LKGSLGAVSTHDLPADDPGGIFVFDAPAAPPNIVILRRKVANQLVVFL
jgi:hypothetical protein